MRGPITALLALLVAIPGLGASSPESNGQKAVLVTGASTGIGRKITEHLAAKGYFVYAGARKEEDLEGARRHRRTCRRSGSTSRKQPDIDAAVETITKAGRGLYGLVNNAGIAARRLDRGHEASRNSTSSWT